MDDDERHAVGLRYKQVGQSSAIKLGNELVSGDIRQQRMQHWLTHTQNFPDGYLYCFRGGLRSRTVQQWLSSEGVAYPLVIGGYKAMRGFLIESLVNSVKTMDFMILAGRTGSGKTLLLKKLQYHLDLEGLAEHRGSSFGATTKPQPSNIDFENAIAVELLRHKASHQHTIFLEDEGKMIGKACIPEVLREHMKGLPSVILDTDMETRIDISLDAYVVELLAMYQAKSDDDSGFAEFAEHHRQSLCKIVKRFGGDNYNKTLALFEHALVQHREKGLLTGYRPYIHKLLHEYYDPMYDYQISRKQRPLLFRGTADEIQAWVKARSAVLTTV